jgi:hypothetical protein
MCPVSDHFSGPRAIAGPQCDICDLYAFPSPERPDRLVLVMDVVPRALPSSAFSDAVIYRFRLRAASADTGEKAAFSIGDEDQEVVIDCSFDAARSTADGRVAQTGRCRTPFADPVTFRLNDTAGGSNGGVRVFAGLRSEPFFLDFPALQQTMMTGTLAFKPVGTLQGPRGLDLLGANVLALVVEFPIAALRSLGVDSLVTVVGETLADGKLQIRLERIGRPEVKNLLLGPKNRDTLNRDLEVRDLYNLEDPYHIGPDYRNAYRARLNANLAYMDSWDGKADWALDANGQHPITDLFLADYLLVDPSKPYAEDTFFEIELAMLAGRPHQSCGGRSLNDQVMDTLYTLCVNGGNGPRISDGLTQATQRALLEFPYLAPPNQPRELVRPGVPVRPDHVHADGTVHHHHYAFGKYEL